MVFYICMILIFGVAVLGVVLDYFTDRKKDWEYWNEI